MKRRQEQQQPDDGVNASESNLNQSPNEDVGNSPAHSGSADSSSSESDEEPSVELMVLSRAKRSNAGSKMAQLIESAEQADDFYQNTYNGDFMEDDTDDVFQPVVDSDDDIIDSDFDRSEEDDEPNSEAEEPEKKRKRVGYKEPKLGAQNRKALFEKNKKWVMARMGCLTATANNVSPETQAQLLEEAKETERRNVASLQKYEQFELEKKKKREKISGARQLKPPFIREVDGPNGKWIIVPDIKKFEKPQRPVNILCSVTSRRAVYRDPVTQLPYATPEAFKMIREKYIEFLKSNPNNPLVKSWLDSNP